MKNSIEKNQNKEIEILKKSIILQKETNYKLKVKLIFFIIFIEKAEA